MLCLHKGAALKFGLCLGIVGTPIPLSKGSPLCLGAEVKPLNLSGTDMSLWS